MRNKILVLISVILLMIGISAIAAKSPKVTLITKQYKQIKYKTKKGHIRVKYIKPERVVPGDIIVYQNVVSNFENKPLENLVLNNKISKYSKYVRYSAKCSLPCKILVSTDGGRTFVKENRVSKRKKITNIRWIFLSKVKPGRKAYASFATKIK